MGRRPRRCGRRARGGRGCGSPSTPPPAPGRTPSAPRNGSTSTMTLAAVTAPARPSPAGNTSSPPRSGTCAPRGPRWPASRAPPRPPARTRRSARSGTCCAGTHGTAVHCRKADDGDQSNPEPDQTLLLSDTPLYGTVRVQAWRGVHPVIHGTRGWFKDHWKGRLPVLRGTVLRVTVDHLPDGRRPHKGPVAVARRPRPAVAGRAVERLPGTLRRRSTPAGSSRAPSGSPPPRSAPLGRPPPGPGASTRHGAIPSSARTVVTLDGWGGYFLVRRCQASCPGAEMSRFQSGVDDIQGMTRIVHVLYVVEQDEDGVWCASARLCPGAGVGRRRADAGSRDRRPTPSA
jgi:hypothetical protein